MEVRVERGRHHTSAGWNKSHNLVFYWKHVKNQVSIKDP